MIDADERVAMQETVRAALDDVVAAGGEDADAVLASLGWLDLLAEQPDDAIAIVFAALGATNARATALDDVMTTAMGWEPRAQLAVLLPPFAAWDAPARIEGDRVVGSGLATARAADARELLMACGTADAPKAIVLPLAEATVHRVEGADPQGGWHTVRVQGAASDAVELEPGAWSSVVALGRRAVAHQLEGACRAMLDLARSHALERTQFGRPIARFQAVRHRLAEALVAVEALDGALTAAREEPGPETAGLAKATAGRASRTVAKHSQQVLAGVGFTTDHAFHHFLKRAMVLEGLFGSADAIVLDVGRRLLDTRQVPTLIEL